MKSFGPEKAIAEHEDAQPAAERSRQTNVGEVQRIDDDQQQTAAEVEHVLVAIYV